jgi:NAD(P)H-flavin reductase
MVTDPASAPEPIVRETATPASWAPEPFELLAKHQEDADTWTLSLRRPSGDPLRFLPGQFTMLSAGGAGEAPISISGDPRTPELLVHTVRVAGLATQAICERAPGQVLGVRGPFGSAWPVAACEGADVVIACGGIGLAPLRPAILALLANRERYGRLVLLYGGRSPDQLLYTQEISGWEQRGIEVLLTVDSAGPEWLGHVGVVTRLLARAALRDPGTFALCCGPEVMMRFMVAALLDAGLSAERIFASLERDMQCGIGLCGHCQLGPTLICRDGPVYRWSQIARWLTIREL